MEKRGKMQKVATIGKFTYFDKNWEKDEYNYTQENYLFGLFSRVVCPKKERNFLSKEKLLKLGFSLLNENYSSFTVLIPEGWSTVEDPINKVTYFHDNNNKLAIESYQLAFVKFL